MNNNFDVVVVIVFRSLKTCEEFTSARKSISDECEGKICECGEKATCIISQAGSKDLKHVCEHHLNTEKIKLALQGYRFYVQSMKVV